MSITHFWSERNHIQLSYSVSFFCKHIRNETMINDIWLEEKWENKKDIFMPHLTNPLEKRKGCSKERTIMKKVLFSITLLSFYFLHLNFLVCQLFKKQIVSSLAENWSFTNEIFLYERTMLSCHNLVIGLFVFVSCQFRQL